MGLAGYVAKKHVFSIKKTNNFLVAAIDPNVGSPLIVGIGSSGKFPLILSTVVIIALLRQYKNII